jgi:hypothetical protein
MILIATLFLGVFTVDWVGKYFRIRWEFTPDPSWPLGHPGKVTFDIGTTNSGYTAWVDIDGYLSGAFWLGNVGWWTFNHADPTVRRAKVLCDDTVFHDPNYICPLDGFWWSQNAGWISLSGTWIGVGSGVYYNPASGRIEGFWHSRALWWIPFYAQAATPVSTTSQTGVLFNGVGLNFIWRLAIIGNIAGTRIYNVTNQQVGYIFSSINHSEMLNTIRKNIALISRNGDPTELADPFDTKYSFMIKRGSDLDTRWWGWVWPAGKKSIIIIGGDVILDPAQVWLATTPDQALIVLKDENGNGGNIIITENVGRIYGFLYAEGSIYSGDKTATWAVVPYINQWVWNIPANQLYIKWVVVSKNTIGGSLQSPPTCPVVITNCTTANSQLYDLNYLRTYDPTDSSQKNVPYNDPRFNNASTVIEYNQSLATNPPPGLAAVLQ